MTDAKLESFEVRARNVIAVAYGGENHVWSLKWNDRRWSMGEGCTFLVGDMASTYDFADLTKLVVACHDECVRGEIRNGGPGHLRIILTPRERKHKHPDMCAHPTLEQHVEQIRRGGNYQPLFDLLRAEENGASK